MTQRQRLLPPILIASAIGIIASLAFGYGILSSWSSRLLDRVFLAHKPNPQIVIVAIDDASITQIGRWPWNRSVHAKLIDALQSAQVKAIGYDVNFPEPSDTENDQALSTALGRVKNVVLPIELTLELGQKALTYDPAQVLAPIDLFRSVSASLGHTNTQPDDDGVVRRIPIAVTSGNGQGSVPAFEMEIARIAQIGLTADQIPQDSFHRMMINYAGAPNETFPMYSAVDVIQGKIPAETFRDKIVFIGSTAPDLHDMLMVPTSGGIPMSGVEIHANVLDTMVSQRWLRDIPYGIQAVFFILLALIVGFSVSLLRARWSLIIATGLVLGSFIATFVLFDRGWVLELFYPFIVITSTFAIVSIERRISAERDRREIRQAFSRYVSPSVVKSILDDQSKLKLGGERRRMTVLFSDIRGFTTISEGLNPEQLVEVLNIYLDRMTGIVFQYDGVLDKYIGDAVMAFWNAPFDQKDHAYRGLCTALDMRDALAEMNETKAFGDLELHIGLGVNTGDMVVGNVGGKTRFDYTVIGDNVNLGSRLEGITKEYGAAIITSASSVQDAKDKILFRRLDKVAVKGKKEPVEIYECLERLDNATTAQKRLASDFEHALEMYFGRSFEEVVDACELLLKKFPADGPTKVLLERAKHFMEEPPPADWIGTWVFTKK